MQIGILSGAAKLFRTCTSPAPSCGGATCAEDADQESSCNTQCCGKLVVFDPERLPFLFTSMIFQLLMAAGAPGPRGGLAFQSLSSRTTSLGTAGQQTSARVRRSGQGAAPARVVEPDALETLWRVKSVGIHSHRTEDQIMLFCVRH